MSDHTTKPTTTAEAQARFEEWRRIQPRAPSWDELSETARENWRAAVLFDRNAPEADTAANPVAADLAWDDFVRAAKAFAPYLDQWEKVAFPTEHGTVYLSIGRKDPYPDSFEAIP